MRKFYVLESDPRYSGPPEFEWINDSDCAPPLGRRVGKYTGKHEFGVGIASYEETPRLVFRKSIKKLHDIEPMTDPMYFSDRMKNLLESMDPEAFEWLQVEAVQGRRIEKVPDLAPFWFGDVIRILDCVDEVNSDIEHYKIDWGENIRRYKRINRLKIRSDLPSNYRVFRLHNSFRTIIVDDSVKDAIEESKYFGSVFKEIGE